jgi:diaminopimelate epimerase
MRFAKGHGTGNDFVILPDPADALVLTPRQVAGICDRHTGVGADGILRAVRTAAGWFMDYRNADGSIAEMCGNGIRVFARYLLDRGLADGPELAVATRAGLRRVTEEPSGDITVDMGAPVVLGRSAAVIGGVRHEGVEVSLGNPHLACLVDVPVAGIDLSRAPAVDPARLPGGANVEVLRVLDSGRLEMRVHERGSGTTLSCGTGAVAAAVAASAAVGAAADTTGSEPGSWAVQVPGGELIVTLTGTTSLLTGPAVIVAEGDLDERWLSGLAAASAPGPAAAAGPAAATVPGSAEVASPDR